MAIAYGAAGTALNQTTAATTWNVAYPASVAANDLLVLHIVTNGGAVTLPSGWTTVYNEVTVVNPKGGLFIKKAVGTESGTLAVTVASTTGVAQMHKYTGVNTTTPQDAGATSVSLDATTDLTIDIPSITTVTANAWYVYAGAINSGSLTATGSGTDTERADFVQSTLGKGGALYDGIQASAGATGTKTITMSGASGRAYWGAMLVLRPASSGAITGSPTGIASAESFGTPVRQGAVTASPTGIASAEATGTPSEIQFRTYDFEDGTAQGWTATTLGVGTAQITTAAAHDGGYGAAGNEPNATGDIGSFTRTIVGGPAYRARISGWWKVTTEGVSTSSNVPFARFFKGTQRLADVYRQNGQAGANVWLRVVKAIGGSNYYFIATGYTLPLDTWVHMSFTWGLDGKPELYINGTRYLSAANAPADWFAATDIDTVWLGSQEVGNQGAWAIDTVEVGTMPTQAATTEFRPLPIVQAEAFGTPSVIGPIVSTPTGITSGQTFGAVVATLVLTASAVGIGSAETFGTPAVSAPVTVSPAGVASGEAFGVPTMGGNYTVSPTGVATAEALGTPTGVLAATAPTGIATAEAFGNPANLGLLTASPPGIASAQAFGVPAAPFSVVYTATGIGSGESFGTSQSFTALTVSPTGVGTGEAVGTATVIYSATVFPPGIASAESVSNINAVLTYTASPSGIASGQAFGAVVAGNGLIAQPAGIVSGEAFGTAAASTAPTAYPTGIASAEFFPNVNAGLTLTSSPTGIGTAQAVGIPAASNGLAVQPPSIDTGAGMGTPAHLGSLTAAPAGVLTGYGPGFPTVTYVTVLAPVGIPTAGALGTASAAITPTSARHLDLTATVPDSRWDVFSLDPLYQADWSTQTFSGKRPSFTVTDLQPRWTTQRLDGEDMQREIQKSAGATEYVGGIITENTGKDLTASTVQVSLGSMTQPGTWVTPATNVLGPVNVRKVTMLVGATPNTPKGEYWVWAKVTDTPETITLRFPQKIVVK